MSGVRSTRRGYAIPSDELRDLVVEATVDCYDKDERRAGLLEAIDDNLELPFKVEVLGLEVEVVDVVLNDGEELVAVCQHGKARQAISLLDLPRPAPLPQGYKWLEAYRYWASER